MKHYWFVLLTFVTLLATGCSKEIEEEPYNPDIVWDDYVGKYFTKESGGFVWTKFENHIVWYTEELRDGEFIEFYDLTDDAITIKTGSEETKYYNLADATGGKIKKRLLCPYYPYYFCKDVEIHTKLRRGDTSSYVCLCETEDLCPEVTVHFEGEYYKTFKLYQEITYNKPDLRSVFGAILGTIDWTCYPFLFNTSTLTCTSTPFVINWTPSSWDGDIATLIPNPQDFLQLLLAIPILNVNDYGFTGWTSDSVSLERLLRALFSKVTSIKTNSDVMPVFAYSTPKKQLVEYENSLIFGDDSGNMTIGVDPSILFNDPVIKTPATSLLMASLLNTLIDEDQCSFPANYTTEYTNDIKGKRIQVLTMMFNNSESARKIWEDVIFPLIVQNKERIKDFLKSDSRFSANSEVLCAAVDKLEKIFETSTITSIGLKWQSDNMHIITEIYTAISIWYTDEFE